MQSKPPVSAVDCIDKIELMEVLTISIGKCLKNLYYISNFVLKKEGFFPLHRIIALESLHY